MFDGASLLIPMLEAELLLIPSLCQTFFELLSFLLDEYAGQVASLPAELFSSVMASLQWGVDCPIDRQQTQRLCLQVWNRSAHSAPRLMFASTCQTRHLILEMFRG